MLTALLLAALVKLNLAIEKPIVPTVIFTVLAFVIGLLLEQEPGQCLYRIHPEIEDRMAGMS